MQELKKNLYNDIWFFYKRNLGKASDEDWELIISEADDIIHKYKGDLFARELVFAVMNELGR